MEFLPSLKMLIICKKDYWNIFLKSQATMIWPYYTVLAIQGNSIRWTAWLA